MSIVAAGLGLPVYKDRVFCIRASHIRSYVSDDCAQALDVAGNNGKGNITFEAIRCAVERLRILFLSNSQFEYALIPIQEYP